MNQQRRNERAERRTHNPSGTNVTLELIFVRDTFQAASTEQKQRAQQRRARAEAATAAAATAEVVRPVRNVVVIVAVSACAATTSQATSFPQREQERERDSLCLSNG